MTPELEALASCPNPWCKYNQLHVFPWSRERKWRVQCQCGIYPGNSDTEAEAITAWNTRTAVVARGDDEMRKAGPSADELEADGVAPWQGRQPIEAQAKRWRGKLWVPLDVAIPALQFWQRRDYEHSRSSPPAPHPHPKPQRPA